MKSDTFISVQRSTTFYGKDFIAVHHHDDRLRLPGVYRITA